MARPAHLRSLLDGTNIARTAPAIVTESVSRKSASRRIPTGGSHEADRVHDVARHLVEHSSPRAGLREILGGGRGALGQTITSIRTIQDPTWGLERVTSRVTLQSPSLSGAFRADFRSTPRLRVSALVGLAFVSHRSTFDTLVERATGNIEPVIKGGYPWWGPTGGLDVTVSLSRTVAIVPEIRAIFFPLADGRGSSAIFRPAIGLRREF